MNKGSTRLRKYQRAREQGHSLVHAAAYAGIGEGEAKLIDDEQERQERRTAAN